MNIPQRADPMGACLCETDFYGWTKEPAHLLRSGPVDLAGMNKFAEEIEALGRSEAAALRSSYRLVAMHPLKMLHHPLRGTAGWENTVRESLDVELALAVDSGRHILVGVGYRLARREAALDRAGPQAVPGEPPFTIEQVESGDFRPEGSP